jgi:sulfoxide reductase heme-binding subunit YedZ
MKPTRGQIIAHFLCLLPLLVLLFAFLRNTLTANPIQELTLRSGRTAVNLLMFTLACRPITNLFGLSAFYKIRIVTGVYAFFYAVVHFLVFIGLDYGFNLMWIFDEIQQKPFIQIGFLALILLVPLAFTSINNVRKKMGAKWQVLHRSVYFITGLAVIHYVMASKGDIVLPIVYGLFLVILLLLRIPPLNRLRIIRDSIWLKKLNIFLLKV